jgi:DNA polymerase
LARASHPATQITLFCEDVVFQDELFEAEIGNQWGFKLSKNQGIYDSRPIKKCEACKLRKECTLPVLPSRGKYNIMVIGEAPGETENKKGYGFAGKSGDILWNELYKYNLDRNQLYVTNAVKCYPKVTGTPANKEIKICTELWLLNEIDRVKPWLILAFGNTCMKIFKEKDVGIMEQSGKTEWDRRFNAWISWCVHPASVLHSPANRILFEKGIANFAYIIYNIGGIENVINSKPSILQIPKVKRLLEK